MKTRTKGEPAMNICERWYYRGAEDARAGRSPLFHETANGYRYVKGRSPWYPEEMEERAGAYLSGYNDILAGICDVASLLDLVSNDA